MYITASDTVSVLVEFKAPTGELVVPDAGTFTYRVIQLNGTELLSPQTPTLNTTDTLTNITLSSPVTDLIGLTDFETIRIKYSYAVAGVTLTGTAELFITPEPTYVVKPEDIRNLIGSSELTLDNNQIPLRDCYITLKNDPQLGAVDLDEELLAGGYRAVVANNLIKYYTACVSIDKLALTLIKTHTEDNISVTHFDVDLDRLKASLMGKFADTLELINPEQATATGVASEGFFVAATPVDPVTGV